MGQIAEFEQGRADRSANARLQLASTLAQMGNRISTGESTAKTKRILINLGVEPYLVQSMSPEEAGKAETQLRIAGMKATGKGGGDDMTMAKFYAGELNSMGVLRIPYDTNKTRYDTLQKKLDEHLAKLESRAIAPSEPSVDQPAPKLDDFKLSGKDAVKMAMGMPVDDEGLNPKPAPVAPAIPVALPVSATPQSYGPPAPDTTIKGGKPQGTARFKKKGK